MAKDTLYEYLKYLLMEMPNNAHLENPEVIDPLPAVVKRAARRMQAETET